MHPRLLCAITLGGPSEIVLLLFEGLVLLPVSVANMSTSHRRRSRSQPLEGIDEVEGCVYGWIIKPVGTCR
jgi:hypothetical protein